MAISATTGSAANSASAASLAAPSFTLTAGQGVLVVVALGSTSSSVSSITDTKGNVYTSIGASNGTGIRVEVWKSLSVGAQAANIITANISPNTDLAIAAEEYAGINSIGNTGSSSDTISNMAAQALTQDTSSFVLAGFAFAAQSGDTLTAVLGTSRQSSIPAATRSAVALYDITAPTIATARDVTRLSTARNWAAFAVELRSGVTGQVANDYASAATAPSGQTNGLGGLGVTFGGPSFTTPTSSGQLFPTRG